MRVEDEYAFGGNVTGLYNGDNPIHDFRKFLQKAKKAGMLPSWWNSSKQAECERVATRSQDHNISHAVEKGGYSGAVWQFDDADDISHAGGEDLWQRELLLRQDRCCSRGIGRQIGRLRGRKRHCGTSSGLGESLKGYAISVILG
jgi:hypothetical protein